MFKKKFRLPLSSRRGGEGCLDGTAIKKILFFFIAASPRKAPKKCFLRVRAWVGLLSQSPVQVEYDISSLHKNIKYRKNIISDNNTKTSV